jgi:hypothetical protein
MGETTTHLCNSCSLLCKQGTGKWYIIERCSWYQPIVKRESPLQLKLFDPNELRYNKNPKIEF